MNTWSIQFPANSTVSINQYIKIFVVRAPVRLCVTDVGVVFR